MRRIVTAISGVALAFSMIASAIPVNAAVAGYDSAYLGQSDWLVRSQGQTGSWTVIFQNTGTTTWTRGTSTEVEFAACLADKVTCNAQDATEAPFNNGWVSATRYADMNQTAVAPGQAASFTVNIRVPATQAAGTYRFNGAVVKADTGADIRNEGAFFDVNVPGTGAAGGITVTPATDTNQTSTTHTVTITFRDSAGAVQPNVPVDVFVVNDATWNNTCSSTQLDGNASPSATGISCTVDAGDFTTNSSGVVTFSFTNTVAGRTNRVVAWTGAVGSTYTSTATQGSATKSWIGAVTNLNLTPSTDINAFATTHTLTATLRDSSNTAVPLADQTIRFIVYRNTVAQPAEGGTTNTCTGTVLSTNVAQTNASGVASFSYTGPADPTATAGDRRFDCVFAFWDQNADGVQGTSDFGRQANKEWTDAAAAATTLALSPRLDGNPTSTTHIVTATLLDQFGNPVSGALIRFTVTRTGATTTATPANVIISTSRTTGSDGTAQLGYVGPTGSTRDVIDACYDVTTTTEACDGTGAIAFTSVDDANKEWATEAVAGTYTGYTVRFCDVANDTVYAQLGTAQMFRFLYDADDQFTVAATPTTLAAFETACTPKTITQASDTVTITYTPGGVSSFNITTNN